MLLVNQTWNLSTSSTSGAAVNCFGAGEQSMVYVSVNDASSANSISLQTSIDGAAPWAAVASTSLTTTNTARVMQFSGPLLHVRPVTSGVAGTVTIQLVTYGD